MVSWEWRTNVRLNTVPPFVQVIAKTAINKDVVLKIKNVVICNKSSLTPSHCWSICSTFNSISSILPFILFWIASDSFTLLHWGGRPWLRCFPRPSQSRRFINSSYVWLYPFIIISSVSLDSPLDNTCVWSKLTCRNFRPIDHRFWWSHGNSKLYEVLGQRNHPQSLELVPLIFVHRSWS